MTTIGLIVVIVILIGNMAVLYLPFEKKTKAKLFLIPFALFLVPCLTSTVQRDNEVPRELICQQIAWKKYRNPEGARAMMATFNVSECELNSIEPTPIEGSVYIIVAMALMTPLLAYVVIKDNDDDSMSDKELKVLLFLNIAACGLLLSLYYGLELTLVPWRKKSDKE